MLHKIPRLSWGIFALFTIHQILQKIAHISMPFFDNHFDPFACSVLGLTVLKIDRKWLWGNQSTVFKWHEVLAATLVLAIISEEVFPRLSDAFTRDILDYFALFAGGLFFYIFINREEV